MTSAPICHVHRIRAPAPKVSQEYTLKYPTQPRMGVTDPDHRGGITRPNIMPEVHPKTVAHHPPKRPLELTRAL
ncbi:hypothetical protein QJS04_geneDACA019703 [Acorus gramineus]|uniref:Uncharacterized protein n=1 Tax=Acorus gramineus TaxID=55184 RepID=A0AAV9BW38_ACOGR|nr:hypothetical protein QJS04_geneDACA019703 [Acorus gramineus]